MIKTKLYILFLKENIQNQYYIYLAKGVAEGREGYTRKTAKYYSFDFIFQQIYVLVK